MTSTSVFAPERVLVANRAIGGQATRVVGALGLLMGCTWLVAVLFLWTIQSRLIFMTGESRAGTAPFDRAIFRQSTFTSTNGLQLESVVLVHDSDPGRYWLLFCPPAGASTRVKRIQEHLRELWDFGYNVFAFDYRGFGVNAGIPTEQGLYADATAAYNSLVNSYGVPASRIILAGRSLGASVAVDLAARIDAAGLLLFSPIDSVPDAGARLYPWAPARLLASNRFDNVAKARAVEEPVILVYGWRDGFMPVSNARALFEKFHGPKLMLETSGAHHHSGFMEPRQLQRALLEFWPPERASSAR